MPNSPAGPTGWTRWRPSFAKWPIRVNVWPSTRVGRSQCKAVIRHSATWSPAPIHRLSRPLRHARARSPPVTPSSATVWRPEHSPPTSLSTTSRRCSSTPVPPEPRARSSGRLTPSPTRAELSLRSSRRQGQLPNRQRIETDVTGILRGKSPTAGPNTTWHCAYDGRPLLASAFRTFGEFSPPVEPNTVRRESRVKRRGVYRGRLRRYELVWTSGSRRAGSRCGGRSVFCRHSDCVGA